MHCPAPYSDAHLLLQNGAAKAAWAQIQERMKPPLCKGHAEPCAIRQVKKGGPNHGARMCCLLLPSSMPPAPI